MDPLVLFGSLRRRLRAKDKGNGRKETLAKARPISDSISNLSSVSTSSERFPQRANMTCKSVLLTLPPDWDFGCDIRNDGRVRSLMRGGPAFASGVIQVGDYARVVKMDTSSVTVQVTFGLLIVQSRPKVPLVVEIGNLSRTSLGLALSDSPANKIRISSIQPGSLSDRCGYLKPGDVLTSIRVNSDQSIPCSPYYTSFQIAHLLRKLASQNSKITLTICPEGSEEAEDERSNGSTATLTEEHEERQRQLRSGFLNFRSFGKSFAASSNSLSSPSSSSEGKVILSLCLWKDRLYEDWGFSLTDSKKEDEEEEKGAFVHQIRRGGPSYQAGLCPGDKILQINDKDVSDLESTHLVPILASLDEALNIVILRSSTEG